jgi:type I restriction enzyme S subunit
MQDSELGEIPNGWEVGTLADLADLNKKSWTKRTIPPEIEYVDLANTKNGIIESTAVYASGDAPSRARRKLSDGDTIIGTVRPGNRSFAFIQQASKILTGSTGFAALSPKHKTYSEFVYIAATSNESINHLAHLADGGAYPAVRPEVVSRIITVIPSNSILERFHELACPYFEHSAILKTESSLLARTKDTLLPRLLSGELCVSKAESELTSAHPETCIFSQFSSPLEVGAELSALKNSGVAK